MIRATASGIDKIKLTGGAGVYPYVTRSDANNGINDWIAAQPAYGIDGGNCITVGLDTQTAFYQSAPFYTCWCCDTHDFCISAKRALSYSCYW